MIPFTSQSRECKGSMFKVYMASVRPHMGAQKDKIVLERVQEKFVKLGWKTAGMRKDWMICNFVSRTEET